MGLFFTRRVKRAQLPEKRRLFAEDFYALTGKYIIFGDTRFCVMHAENFDVTDSVSLRGVEQIVRRLKSLAEIFREFDKRVEFFAAAAAADVRPGQ